MAKKNDNTMVKNASFLMVAALVSKIIGMLYKSPLSTILGNESYALFQYAQNAYFILLMISSFTIPQAVSKLMAEKIAFRRYRDAQRIFHGSMLYACVAGGAVALFCVFGANLMVPESMADARLALKFLAPTIFLSGILGVFRGYFQAYRNMLPTSLSQIIEQIFVAVVALIMAGFMVKRFAGQGTQVVQRWSAAGATVGTGAGVLAALIFMVGIYLLNVGVIHRKVKQDIISRDEPMMAVMQNIVLIIMPIILSAFIYNVNGFINSYMYSGIMGRKGVDPVQIKSLYAEYGYFMTLINIPLTLASTAPTSMIPEVSAAYAKKDMNLARSKVDRAAWISMLISIPCAVGLGVLAGPVTRLIFPGTNGAASQLMLLGVVTIVLYGNSNISNGVLQGIGKADIPMKNAAISLAADVVVMLVLLFFTNLGIYTVVIAMILYGVVMCVLNDLALKKYLKYSNPWEKAYLTPMIASVPMALTAGLLYYLLYSLFHRNIIAIIPAVVLAVFVYFIVYLIASHPSEEELAMIPGNRYFSAVLAWLQAVGEGVKQMLAGSVSRAAAARKTKSENKERKPGRVKTDSLEDEEEDITKDSEEDDILPDDSEESGSRAGFRRTNPARKNRIERSDADMLDKLDKPKRKLFFQKDYSDYDVDVELNEIDEADFFDDED